MEGAKNNLPDADAQQSAECIRELSSGLTEKDLLLVLISGTIAYFLHIESVFLWQRALRFKSLERFNVFEK